MENETDHPHDHSPSALSILGWLMVMLAIIGATALLRQEQNEIAAQAATAAQQRAAKVASLEAKIDAIQQQLANTPAGKPDETLGNALKDANTQLSTISTRLDALEANLKKPATATPAANAGSTRQLLALQAKLLRGEPYADDLDMLAASPALAKDADAIASLRTNATTGVPTELKLNRDFHDALGKTAPSVPASPTLQKVNAHLGGLVTIKPHSAEAGDVYQALRDLPADAPLAVLVEKTAALPNDARAPFEAWLKEVQARDKALEALHQLEAHLLPA